MCQLHCCSSDRYSMAMQVPWCQDREQLCFLTDVLQRRTCQRPKHHTGAGTLSRQCEQGRELMR